MTVSESPSHNHDGSTGGGITSFMRIVDMAGLGYAANHNVGLSPASSTDMSGDNFPGANHYHNFTTNSTGGNGSHSHSINTTSASTTNTGSASAVSVVQSYYTVYIWTRTA